MAYIQSGKDQGATIVTGGDRWAQSGEGFWVEPTIMVDVNDDMTCVREEAGFTLLTVTTELTALDLRARRSHFTIQNRVRSAGTRQRLNIRPRRGRFHPRYPAGYARLCRH
jgi:hypothetical protein